MKTIKERKKSIGVPRVNSKDKYVDSIQQYLIEFGFNTDIVKSSIERCIEKGFYNMTMSEQADSMTQLVLNLAKDNKTKKELIAYFYKSKNHRIRCRIPMMIYDTYKNSPIEMLENLKVIANDEATGPRENAQGAIRKLLIWQGIDFLNEVVKLKEDPNENVRRAFVEATRPRGVWVEHISFLKDEPVYLYPHLQKLLNDKSEYVKTAIANSINDISKDHKDIAIEWCKEWRNMYGDKIQWIIKQGLRWLRKQGNLKVMELEGYFFPENITMEIALPNGRDIAYNEIVPFELTLENKGEKELSCCLQYKIYKPNGRFKIYEGGIFKLPSKNSQKIIRCQHFSDTSAYKLQDGYYAVEWIINGFKLGEINLDFKRNKSEHETF